MKKIISILIFFSPYLFGQSIILDDYIKFGLKNNLALKQKIFALDQSITDLKQARGMFFPSIEINARYSRAGGGRVIDIPIGDLVNPIHQGLNFLNPSFNYPTNIPNGVTRFLREEEHETKISLIQPIIQPALFYNHSIKSNLVDIQKAEKTIYSRNLIADIKEAYFNYLKSLKVKLLFRTTKNLVSENLRITKSLFDNDKVTIDLLYKAEAELSEIEEKELEAENNADLAASYFNFLLNRPLESEIIVDSIAINDIDLSSLWEFEILAVNNREELEQLRLAIQATEDNKGLAKSGYLPGVSLAADYGFQGEKYSFSKDDDYWMASLVLNWNLFNGFQDASKVEKAEIELKSINAKISETENLIKIQTKEAYKNFYLARDRIKAADDRLKGYEKAFRIVSKKFAEGLASQLEYLDARQKYTQSEIQKIIAEYEMLAIYAELEKVTASIDIELLLKENK